MDKQNILIIDDDNKSIHLVTSALNISNLYNIHFAINAKNGIEQLELREHSLIILDVNSPQLDANETVKIIKNSSLQNQIPIIFLSEISPAKPFRKEEFLRKVKRNIKLYLSRKKQIEIDDTKILLEQYKIATDAGSLVSKTDARGIITYVNDRFCEVSKYSREELIGNPHNITRSPDVSKDTFKDLWETILAKETWKGTIKNRAKDGSPYYVESTVMPILNANDEIVTYISIRTDITSREITLREGILSSQKEILNTLGELGEWRSKETGEHVTRVSLFSEMLAKAYDCSEEEIQLIKMASPMHDIGKVIIPDNILLKPGKLTKEESLVMQNHTLYGWEIFNKSKNALLQAAALIAHQHHERWDGTGYPRGIGGEDIHVFGRITAVADVFDALTQERAYKKAWSLEKTLDFMKDESGKAFDPKIIDLLLENIDEIIEIKTLHTKE